jgi:Mg2+-importing ATPase
MAAMLLYWSQEISEVSKQLGSSPSGLSQEEALARIQKFGPNRIQAEKRSTPLGLFFRQFMNPLALILIMATIVSAFLRDWPDAVIIMVIILGSGVLSFFQEYNSSNAAARLREQVSLETLVRRDGKLASIATEQVVPGDVVLLSAGSLVPADGLVLEATDFFVNQAVLTGETFPVEKKAGAVSKEAGLPERKNVVFKGTNVRSGTASVLVVETGSRTVFGQIANRLTLRPPETEFERGIKRLSYLLTEVMFILVLAIFALNVFFHKPVLDSLLFSVALAVGLTPQLLPAIININLSTGSQKMAERGVIVRRLESIENFGSINVLCTDKTGTLTEGIVRLDRALDVEGEVSDQVRLQAYLNASLQTGLRNPLDEAVVRDSPPGADAYVKLDEIPYDFVRKRLSVVVREPVGSAVLITKGALENVLFVCTLVRQGMRDEPLDDRARTTIRDKFEGWSSQGFRVLGVAVKSVQPQADPYTIRDEEDLTFIGFLLFFDPPKPGVRETIQALEKLGVQLKIVTGDNRFVAEHVGNAVGMRGARVLTGADLEQLRDEALWHAVPETEIFAEVDPNQKERIILALKKRGYIVGYMGDGINDAPSLHSADVGISVDNAVDVAKEAADLVLLRQDLDVLRQGILQGRVTFANTLKYVFMATSANFGNMFSVAGASLFLPYLPMLPKQILMINFLTDLPEMTIANDNVDETYVAHPHRWDITFIRRFMVIFGPLSSFFDLATFAALLWLMKASESAFHTGWFIESVVSAAVVVFAVRSRLPVTRSRPSRAMLLVTGGVVAAALALPYSPVGALLGLTPLSLTYLLAILAIVVVYFLTAEFAKRLFYRRFGV